MVSPVNTFWGIYENHLLIKNSQTKTLSTKNFNLSLRTYLDNNHLSNIQYSKKKNLAHRFW